MNRQQTKTQLENTIESVSEALQTQLGDYKKIGKNGLIIGGILVAGYALSRILAGNDNEPETPKSNQPSMLTKAASGIATSLILSILKNKLSEFLENQNNEQ